MATLPDKPSDLIEFALTALIKCERSPKYKIDMKGWHWPSNGACYVCLAGSVMAQVLGADPHTPRRPGDFDPLITRSLRALDYFRAGECEWAFWTMALDRKQGEPFSRRVTPYWKSPVKFKREMRKLARDLRAGGF